MLNGALSCVRQGAAMHGNQVLRHETSSVADPSHGWVSTIIFNPDSRTRGGDHYSSDCCRESRTLH